MVSGSRLIQAYRQAPWRKQLQWIGLFVSAVIFLALVAGGYLNVSARAAQAGREVQGMQARARDLEQSNENLRTVLAYLTSGRTMQQRAEDLGFVRVSKDRLTYIEAPGYGGRPETSLAVHANQPAFTGTDQLPGAYTQSLFEWVGEMINLLALQTGAQTGGQP
ncbi:MAG: hypothetical protein EPO32_10295 [Anaerolineae bacterium]|nr:MAG: hypothetical protein EPO32_10295 [Anaerolineae bacterium]